MIAADVSWVAANLDVILVGLGGLAGTIGAAVIAKRGARDVAQLGAEQGAYTRASEIDAGVVERLEAENTRLTKGWADDRTTWAAEKAELRAEVAELERRLRAEVEAGVERQRRLSDLLDEVARLRTRHDEDAAPTGA